MIRVRQQMLATIALGALCVYGIVRSANILSLVSRLILATSTEEWIVSTATKTTPQYNCTEAALSTTRQRAALCVIAIDEEAYLQEFVDYHLALGFDLIHIMDNSDNFDLEQFAQGKDCRVKVEHFPGPVKQFLAYAECSARLIAEGNYGWVAFYDVDEFLILKKHRNVIDFLEEYVPSGSLAVNWRFFEMSGKKVYEPLPVTKRFQYRLPDEAEINYHIKSIVRLSSLNTKEMKRWDNPHFFPLVHGAYQYDTNGTRVEGPYNPGGKVDVVALYHFSFKSMKEYVAKRNRGRSDVPRNEEEIATLIAMAESLWKTSNESYIFDDTAWRMLKDLVPRYSQFD
jgi:Glycosyl transferase family 2